MTSHPLLNAEVQKFIRNNETSPLHKLILQGSPFPHISIQDIVQQIQGRQKTKEKLPVWFKTNSIIFPPKLNLEQTSSSLTAAYKAGQLTGKTLLDATGGFGVDSYYFSNVVETVTHIEIDTELSNIAQHNFAVLGATNIKTIQVDAIDYLKNSNYHFDTIYIDPSRRSDTKRKVFVLEDCTPDVVVHLQLLLSRCDNLWIKTAPMLDISAGLKVLQHVHDVHIVAVKNEVKELLWHIKTKSNAAAIHLITMNLGTSQAMQKFTLDDLQDAQATYDLPKSYLYEPNAPLMKSGAFNWVSCTFKVDKLHENTHLYTSKGLMDFPGRRFGIDSVIPYSKKINKVLQLKKAHITTRNFKLTVAQLRKTLKIADGGDTYLFFVTQMNGKSVVLVCRKV